LKHKSQVHLVEIIFGCIIFFSILSFLTLYSPPVLESNYEEIQIKLIVDDVLEVLAVNNALVKNNNISTENITYMLNQTLPHHVTYNIYLISFNLSTNTFQTEILYWSSKASKKTVVSNRFVTIGGVPKELRVVVVWFV